MNLSVLKELHQFLVKSHKIKEASELSDIIAAAEEDETFEEPAAELVDSEKEDLHMKDLVKEVVEKFLSDPNSANYMAAEQALRDFYNTNLNLGENDIIATREVFLSKLSGISDKLDSLGCIKEADEVDWIIKKVAEEGKEQYDFEANNEKNTRTQEVGKKKEDKSDVKPFSATKSVSLSTRHCPEHVGVMLERIGDYVYQCPLDHKVFNWESGWTDHLGTKNPGGSVAGQTPDYADFASPHRIFERGRNS